MAHLNMMGNHWNAGNQGWHGNSFNGSNMSLNMMPNPGFVSNDHQMWNPWLQQQYPYPMMPGGETELRECRRIFKTVLYISGMPPRSLHHSRAPSPSLSVRSRRSTMSSRNRQKFVPRDLTDDEDSDIENFTDDSRSRTRRNEGRTRPRRNTEQIDLDYRETEVVSRIQRMKEKSKHIRERRSGSLSNWPPTKARDSGSLTPSDEEIKKVASKYRKSSLTSPVPQNKRLLSDSASEKEKEVPDKQKEQKSSPKASQQVQSDSTSGQESKQEKSLKASDKTIKKKSETESEIDCEPLAKVVEKKLVSENRPLKVPNNISKTLNGSSIKKEEKKIVVPTKEEKPKENLMPTKSESVVAKSAPQAVEKKEIPLGAVNEAWECPHCTFVNEAAATVCTICCKTRVDVLKQLPKTEVDIDINEINESILQNESDAKQKGKVRKISFLPGTKAH